MTLKKEGIKQLDKYKVAETETFSKKITSKKFSHLYQKIFDDVYPILRNNPFFGTNIKKLKEEYKEIYRFRIGDYRLFYIIDDNERIIFIIDIENRKDAYKQRNILGFLQNTVDKQMFFRDLSIINDKMFMGYTLSTTRNSTMIKPEDRECIL